MSHRASTLAHCMLPITGVLLAVSLAGCADRQQGPPTVEPTEPPPKPRTAVLAPETEISIEIVRTDDGTPAGLTIRPLSAVVCTHPDKHCARVGVWRLLSQLKDGESIEIGYLEHVHGSPLPEIFGEQPFRIDEEGLDARFEIPEAYATIKPPPDQTFVNWYYNVKLAYGEGQIIEEDPRVVIDRTR